LKVVLIPFLILALVADPRQWTENHVAHWLQWAVKEFSLECIPLHQFRMKGKDICAMGKDAFAARAPAFVGDILWEHLEQLQKGTSQMTHQLARPASVRATHARKKSFRGTQRVISRPETNIVISINLIDVVSGPIKASIT
jgi:hypothetical protein